MPFTEFTNRIVLPTTNTEYVVGTLSPNFDSVDVYVDPGASAGITRLLWRLYSTVGGVTVRIAENLWAPSSISYRPFSSIGTNISGNPDSASSLELRVVAVDRPVPAPGLVGGMCGYDTTVANAPNEVVTRTAELVYMEPVLFGTLLTDHTYVQVQVDTDLALDVGSLWQIYGQITGSGGTISAMVSQGGIQSVSSPLIPQVVVSSTKVGASSYRIYGLLTDSRYNGLAVKASAVGSDPNVEGISPIPPSLLYYQTVKDAGFSLPQQPALNFIGATVTNNSSENSTDVAFYGDSQLAFAAACDPSLSVGSAVYVSSSIGGLPSAAKSSADDAASVPARGMVVSKSSPTRCTVMAVGRTPASGLTAGKSYWLGLNGEVTETIPSSPTSPIFIQQLGYAISDESLFVQVSDNVTAVYP